MNKRWWKCAGIRAIKTIAQSAVGMLGTSAVGILDVNWISVLSVAMMAGVVSLLTSIAGLPELDEEEEK